MIQKETEKKIKKLNKRSKFLGLTSIFLLLASIGFGLKSENYRNRIDSSAIQEWVWDRNSRNALDRILKQPIEDLNAYSFLKTHDSLYNQYITWMRSKDSLENQMDSLYRITGGLTRLPSDTNTNYNLLFASSMLCFLGAYGTAQFSLLFNEIKKEYEQDLKKK